MSGHQDEVVSLIKRGSMNAVGSIKIKAPLYFKSAEGQTLRWDSLILHMCQLAVDPWLISDKKNFLVSIPVPGSRL